LKKDCRYKPAISQDQSLFKMPLFLKYGIISIFSLGVDIMSPGENKGIPGLAKGARIRPGIVLPFWGAASADP
jgi:hypothetical protein